MEQLDDKGKYPKTGMILSVRQITFQAVAINSYELVHPEGDELPPFTAGAHIDFHFRDGSVRQYSLCNDPEERCRYVIAVLRESNGRGGSQALHERLHVQRTVSVGKPRNNFPLAGDAKRHLLLAGGIGITPLKAMVHQLERAGGNYTLHYCTKAPRHTAFRDEFASLIAKGRVKYHHDGGNPSNGLDIAALLQDYQDGTHLYYCGPPGFMAACKRSSAHWPADKVHCEYFTAAAAPKSALSGAELADAGDNALGLGFQVKVASTGAVYTVPDDKSIVQVLEEHGIAIETSCKAGLCATCKVRYLSGEVDHRDLVLNEQEQTEYLAACISRARSSLLVLDL
jgi:tert-butyl alcohol monooxygenase/tert-amyl alcohol desaturase reductase